MNNKKATIQVLKRRFKVKKKNAPEKINPIKNFYSKFAHYSACRYLDSDQFAIYEAQFPEYAHGFYTKSGADQYNHDALDIDIDKHVLDEHKHIDEQLESHIATLEDLHIGVEVEKTSVEAKIEQVNQLLKGCFYERDLLNTRYDSFNRKVG